MQQKLARIVAKVVAIILVVVLVLGSFGYNAYIMFNQWKFSVTQQGFQLALQQVVQTSQKEGKIIIPFTDKDGKQTSVTLLLTDIPSNDTKK